MRSEFAEKASRRYCEAVRRVRREEVLNGPHVIAGIALFQVTIDGDAHRFRYLAWRYDRGRARRALPHMCNDEITKLLLKRLNLAEERLDLR